MNLKKRVSETIARYRMTEQGDLLVVAVSGGPDSMCLLDTLNQLSDDLGIRLVVAHYDHGLREMEDEEETRLVREIAASLDLPFETEKADCLDKDESSVEERARDARYGFLERVLKRHQAQKIATGHNLDDQAETVLMRLLRGSGPPGLAGIPPVRENRIIRPLVEIRREDIVSYLKVRGLPYAIDSSNTDTRYLRNRIRLELLPLMQEYQPQLVEHLGRLSVILRGEDSYMEEQAAGWIGRRAEELMDGDVAVPLKAFASLPCPLRNRIARQLVRKVGNGLRRIDNDHIRAIESLVNSSSPHAGIDLPDGLSVRRVYERMLFSSGNEQGAGEFSYLLEGPGTLLMEDINRSVLAEVLDAFSDMNMNVSRWTAFLDAAKIQYPLVIRNFRPGDRFIPLGMKGHKKIKDFFIDLKVPSEKRSSIPIIISQDLPVWICGYRLDERFKVTSRTEKILKITIQPF